MKYLNQAGDTIIEVLIAIAVVSVVLSSAYGITSRNLANSRDAQEHSQAQKIVQAQIEQIKIKADSQSTPIIGAVAASAGHHSCFAITASGGVNLGDQVNTSKTGVLMSDGTYSANCINSATIEYRTGFKYDSADKSYLATVTWYSTRGIESKVSMVYRVGK